MMAATAAGMLLSNLFQGSWGYLVSGRIGRAGLFGPRQAGRISTREALHSRQRATHPQRAGLFRR